MSEKESREWERLRGREKEKEKGRGVKIGLASADTFPQIYCFFVFFCCCFFYQSIPLSLHITRPRANIFFPLREYHGIREPVFLLQPLWKYCIVLVQSSNFMPLFCFFIDVIDVGIIRYAFYDKIAPTTLDFCLKLRNLLTSLIFILEIMQFDLFFWDQEYIRWDKAE